MKNIFFLDTANIQKFTPVQQIDDDEVLRRHRVVRPDQILCRREPGTSSCTV